MKAKGIDDQIKAIGKSGYATDPRYGRKLRAVALGIELPPEPQPEDKPVVQEQRPVEQREQAPPTEQPQPPEQEAEAVNYNQTDPRDEPVAFADGGAVDDFISHDDPRRQDNFSNWFGYSHIVDQSGNPVTLYHGTDADVSEFDPSKVGQTDHGWYGEGHYLTASPELASGYSGYKNTKAIAGEEIHPGQNVMPVHARLENPYYWPEERRAATSRDEAKKITNELRKQGYDGVIAPNKYAEGPEAKFWEVVVFTPHQIKSATGNNGHYNMKSARIDRADGGPANFEDFALSKLEPFELDVPSEPHKGINPSREEALSTLNQRTDGPQPDPRVFKEQESLSNEENARLSAIDKSGVKIPNIAPFKADLGKGNEVRGQVVQAGPYIDIGGGVTIPIKDYKLMLDASAGKVPGTRMKPNTSIKAGLRVPFNDGGSVDDEGEGLTAYHGSPHDFEQFDTSKIGTGEGAQSYGHGLYFAESEPVAKQYRENLTAGTYKGDTGQVFDPFSDLEHLNVRVAAYKSIDNAIDRAKGLLEDYPNSDAIKRDLAKLMEAKAQNATPQTGHMYEVKINAHPDHFLDWDTPLNEQSEHVQSAIKSIANSVDVDQFDHLALAASIGKHPRSQDYSPRGNDLYADLEEIVGDRTKLSDLLHQHGLKGIRYLDAGSRFSGKGSRNYVVFNHDHVQVKRKYARGGAIDET
jgi:hypothetical protein